MPDGAVRVSPGRYTTQEELDRLGEAIEKIATA